MLEIYLGRDEIMGIHVGRIIHEFGEGAEHTDGSIGIISSRRFCNPKEVNVLGATIAISGAVITV